MISVSSKDIKKIFLTANTTINTLGSKVDIIVSPEFYWVRKFDLPVKTITQARHLLPTLFEDIVNEKATLNYQVIKLAENSFLCFAYNNKKIYEAIKKANIQISNISSIYFAQNECSAFNSFEVDKQNFLYTKEGILVKVPSSLAQDAIKLESVIDSIKLSSNKLQIKLYNDVLSTKFYYTFFSIFAVLIVLSLIKYFSFSSSMGDLEKFTTSLKNKNNLPSSVLQMNSVLKKYDTHIKKQKLKREAIAYIFSNSKFNLQSLDLRSDVIDLEYLSANKNEVERFLKKKYKVVSSRVDAFKLKVSIKI